MKRRRGASRNQKAPQRRGHRAAGGGRPQGGFTLIELLIVVAIIAILAAIAVPNFLQARTRAMLARTRADMRTVATALQAYRVDAAGWPRPAGFVADLSSLTTELMDQHRLPEALTTPVAYVTSLPPDPFANGDGYARRFHYLLRTQTRREGAEGLQRIRIGLEYADWHILSVGPDGEYNISVERDPEAGIVKAFYLQRYDETDGTTSRGDLFYFGPGFGFQN